MNTGCSPISPIIAARWCRAPNWWSISTTRTSTATPIRSRFLSAACARSWTRALFKRCAGLAIRWKIPNWAARRLRLESLSSRLIAAAAIWTMLGLVVGGAVLSNAFRMAAQNSFDAALQADMDGLIAAAEPDPNGGVMLADRFLNHNFDRVYSGLYYQIKVGQSGGQILRSLFDKDINPGNENRKSALTLGSAAGAEKPTL